MPADLTLTKDDHAVFNLVPDVWWDEREVGQLITREHGYKSGDISQRISRFVAIGIVERRPGTWALEKTEIRKVRK